MKPIRYPLMNTDMVTIIHDGIHKAGSQNKLAKAAGVDQGMISNYLSGKKINISFTTAAKLIDYIR